MQVGQQPHRTLAVLAVHLGVGPAAPRGDAPVDAARVVAGGIRTHFLEFQAAAALGAAMAALQARQRRAVRAQVETLGGAAQGNQLGQIRQDHGAGTWLSSSSTQAWAVTPRACAV